MKGEPRKAVPTKAVAMKGEPTKEEPRPGKQLDVLMAEFKALRDEIGQRATYCHTLINTNVLATGTVAGFALEDTSRVTLLLILPILNPVLGLLWLDHSYAIRGMGDYIEKGLRPHVNRYAEGDGDLLGWEGFLDEHEQRSKLLRFVPLGVPIGILFAAIPLVSLAYTPANLDGVWEWVLWLIGASLTASFLVMWYLLVTKPFGRHARSSAAP